MNDFVKQSEDNRPNRPINAVSIMEASGSAAIAKAAGTAIRKISMPRSSSLNTFLQIKVKTSKLLAYRIRYP